MAYKPQGVVADWLLRTYGGLFTYEDSNPSVGVTAVELVNNDPERVHLTIVNLSINTLVVAPFRDVTLTNGIVLAPSGGNITLNVREDLILPSLNWYAIAGGAASNVFINTVRRYSPGPVGDANNESG